MKLSRPKVAFLPEAFLGASGGRDFITHCVNALSLKDQIEVYLFINKQVVRDLGEDSDFTKNLSPNLNVVHSDESGRYSVNFRPDTIFTSLRPLGRNFPTPWIGYAYDFQHRYFPQWFSLPEREGRDRHFAQMLSEARAIIVNSQAVKEDIFRFFPNTECEVFCLPFAPTPFPRWLDEPREDVLARYRLPERFFIISNQFWVHKDHTTAFRAFSLLKQRYRDSIALVCTGEPSDHRFPGYFNQLKDLIRRLGIGDAIHILGLIPKADQIQLMRRAAAVLQPTLFEGGPGGGAVNNAVALGLQAIVSDIPVNREINSPGVRFFKAGSADDLAAKMEALLSSDSPRSLDKDRLLELGQQNSHALADRLLDAVRYVTNKPAR